MYIVYIYAHWPLPIYAIGHCPFLKKNVKIFVQKMVMLAGTRQTAVLQVTDCSVVPKSFTKSSTAKTYDGKE